MTLIESTTHAAKVAGKNFVPYVIVCVLLAIGLVAYDTNFFTKPPSWWSAYHSWSVEPIDIHDPTPGASK